MNIQSRHRNIMMTNEINIKLESESKLVDQIVPLEGSQILIYLEDGYYNIYDIMSNSIVQSGQLIQNIKQFYSLKPNYVCYLDTNDWHIKLIDFNVSHFGKKLMKVDKNIFPLKDYVISIEHGQTVQIAIYKDVYQTYTLIWRHHHPNLTGQSQLFYSIINDETIVIYGQDFPRKDYEILFVQPALGDKGFHNLKWHDSRILTLINISKCYIELLSLDLWVKDEQLQFRLPLQWKSISCIIDGDKTQQFLDIVGFQDDNQYIWQKWMRNNQVTLSLVDWSDKSIIQSIVFTDYFQQSTNEYILHYNNLDSMQLSVSSCHTIEYEILKIMEHKQLIEIYGISTICEIFTLLND